MENDYNDSETFASTNAKKHLAKEISRLRHLRRPVFHPAQMFHAIAQVELVLFVHQLVKGDGCLLSKLQGKKQLW